MPNEQNITLDSAWYLEPTGTIAGWRPPIGSKPSIDAILRDFSSNTRVLQGVQFDESNGAVSLTIANSQTQAFVAGQELSGTFETKGSLSVTVGDLSLTAALNGADTNEPYTWIPGNSAEVISFTTAVRALGTVPDAQLTLRDFVPAGTTEQTIQLPDTWYSFQVLSASVSVLSYAAPSGNRPLIDAGLRGTSATRRYQTFSITNSGQITLNLEGSDADLSPAFEQNGSVSLTFGSTTVTAPIGSDDEEPYTWTPDNASEWVSIYNAIRNAGNGNRAASLTIRDFTPSGLFNMHVAGNRADDFKRGSQQVDRIYRGAAEVFRAA